MSHFVRKKCVRLHVSHLMLCSFKSPFVFTRRFSSVSAFLFVITWWTDIHTAAPCMTTCINFTHNFLHVPMKNLKSCHCRSLSAKPWGCIMAPQGRSFPFSPTGKFYQWDFGRTFGGCKSHKVITERLQKIPDIVDVRFSHQPVSTKKCI